VTEHTQQCWYARSANGKRLLHGREGQSKQWPGCSICTPADKAAAQATCNNLKEQIPPFYQLEHNAMPAAHLVMFLNRAALTNASPSTSVHPCPVPLAATAGNGRCWSQPQHPGTCHMGCCYPQPCKHVGPAPAYHLQLFAGREKMQAQERTQQYFIILATFWSQVSHLAMGTTNMITTWRYTCARVQLPGGLAACRSSSIAVGIKEPKNRFCR
jgi:hypothetical protein